MQKILLPSYNKLVFLNRKTQDITEIEFIIYAIIETLIYIKFVILIVHKYEKKR